MSRLLDNLATVREKIAGAAERSGRTADAVKLVAVTKYVRDDVVCELVSAGCRDLGEARPQALWKRVPALARRLESDRSSQRDICWHLVGHLQRNKVEQTLPLVSLIHSADSLRLLQAIDEAAARLGHRVPILIEVNVSGDSTKHGFAADEVGPVFAQAATLAHVDVRGLMCMAAREGDTDVARRNFAMLRALRDRCAEGLPENVSLAELSMGMSGDYEIAIEEGATIVRIGSALFEGVV
jgi:pyridoxal phosphate enzyme (YggS family)